MRITDCASIFHDVSSIACPGALTQEIAGQSIKPSLNGIDIKGSSTSQVITVQPTLAILASSAIWGKKSEVLSNHTENAPSSPNRNQIDKQHTESMYSHLNRRRKQGEEMVTPPLVVSTLRRLQTPPILSDDNDYRFVPVLCQHHHIVLIALLISLIIEDLGSASEKLLTIYGMLKKKELPACRCRSTQYQTHSDSGEISAK
ncbi:unnamed protein product [Leuciscus chuanchicus]